MKDHEAPPWGSGAPREMAGRAPRKVIVVEDKLVNVVG